MEGDMKKKRRKNNQELEMFTCEYKDSVLDYQVICGGFCCCLFRFQRSVKRELFAFLVITISGHFETG